MNDRSIIETPEPNGREIWVDGYLPSGVVQEQAQQPSHFDIAWLRGALFRQRWVISATLLATVLVGLVVTLLATPIYQASATSRIQPWGNFIVEGQDVSSPIGSSNEISNFMETLGVVIESRNLAEVVVQELNLDTRNALLGPDVDATRPPQLDDSEWGEERDKMAAAILQSNVTAVVPFDSQIITINYRSADPVLAAEIANGYADAFQKSDTRRNIESNAYAREVLLAEIEGVRARLVEAERSTNSYARNAGIVTPQTTGSGGESGGPTITGANLASINQTVAKARADRIAAEQRWRSVANIPASELPEVQGSPVFQNLIQQKAELQVNLTNLRQRYNEQFPEIVDLKARIGVIDDQIAQTGEDIKAAIRSEYTIAANQEIALNNELNSLTQDALTQQDNTVEFTGLEREAEALRLQLTVLLNRYNQISTAANVENGMISTLDRAVVPGAPIEPDLVRNTILSLVIGIALAAGLALTREIFVDQLRSAEDVDQRLKLPVFGVTPYVKSEAIEREETNQFSSLMEAYASIRSTIDFSIPRDRAVVQLTSSQASEGKSTTALIMAELFARLGRKTLLIDADLRKPSISKLLDSNTQEAGLTEVLLGHVSMEEAVLDGVHENLTVLSVAGTPANPAELLSSGRLKDFIKEQRQNYSLIIIDSPPVLGLADAPEIAQIVDASIFVIEANRTSISQAKSALKRLEHVGANIAGVILTKYRALEAGSDYAYQEQYQYYRYGDDPK